jgi:hypothetical protein
MECLSEEGYVVSRMRVYVTRLLLAISKYHENEDLESAIHEFQIKPSDLNYISKKSKQVALRYLQCWKDVIVRKGEEKKGDHLFQNGEITPAFLDSVYSLRYVSSIVKSNDSNVSTST